jgi:hypothetical protein
MLGLQGQHAVGQAEDLDPVESIARVPRLKADFCEGRSCRNQRERGTAIVPISLVQRLFIEGEPARAL